MVDTGPEDERRRRAEPPPLEFVKPEEPQAPLPARDQPPAAWVPRPEEFQRPQQPWAPVAPPAGGNRARIAGVLMVLAGLLGMAETFLILIQPLTPQEIANISSITSQEYVSSAVIFLGLSFAQSAAVLGGIMALQRKNWKLAVGCGVLSLATFGFLIGSFLGLVALLLVLRARHEFVS